jgi:His-Xaa-Ser system radical SAM maturase HxsB
VAELAQTYFNGPIKGRGDYIINHFRMKSLKDRHLITTDAGSWVILDKKEYNSLIRHETDEMLFRLLEEKCIIITENNLDTLDGYYKERYHFLFKGVALHIIVPTLRCNQKCVYCHSSAAPSCDSNRDMDRETAIKTLEFIFQTPATDITIEFQGGDTLENFELFKFIITEAKRLNEKHRKKINFELVTNLTLMTEERLDWIAQEGVQVSTSLDGPKEIHDKNRKYENGAGTYDDVAKWLARFRQRGIPVGALMVTTRHSLKHWKGIIDEYVRWGLHSIQIKPLNPLGFAEKTWKEIGYTPEEFIEFWKKCADYTLELNRQGIMIRERKISLILAKILTKRDPSFLDFRNPCGAVIGQLAYNYNGDIFTCDEGRNYEMCILGNVKESKYAEVISQEKSQFFISSSMNENLLCDNCAYKSWCGTCPVVNYAESNNIIPKLATSSKCKLFKSYFDYVFDRITEEEGIGIFNAYINRQETEEDAHELEIFKEVVSGAYCLDVSKITLFAKTDHSKIFRIETNDGTKILKVNSSETDTAALEKTLSFIEMLREKGLKTPKIHKTKNSTLFFRFGNRIGELFEYIEGRLATYDDLRPAAENLAAFHTMTENIKNPAFPDILPLIIEHGIPGIRKTLAEKPTILKISGNGSGSITELISVALDEAEKCLPFLQKLDKRTIHTDFFQNNFLISGENHYILDFDSLKQGPLLFDLAKSAIDFSAEYDTINTEKAAEFIQAYNSKMKLPKDQILHLREAMILLVLGSIYFGVKDPEANTEKIKIRTNILKEVYTKITGKWLQSISS